MEWLDDYQEEFKCFHGLDTDSVMKDYQEYGREYQENEENETICTN